MGRKSPISLSSPTNPYKLQNPRLQNRIGQLRFADGVHPHMTSLLKPIRLRPLLPSFSSSLHLQPRQHPNHLTTTTISDSWYLKAIYTLCVRNHPLENYSDFFNKGLNPSNTFHVIYNLSTHPQSAFQFFDFTRRALNLAHLPNVYTFVVSILSDNGMHDLARSVIDYAEKDRVYMHPSAVNVFLAILVEFDKVDVTERFLNEVESRKVGKGVFHRNVVLNVLVKVNNVDAAVRLLREFLIVRGHAGTRSFNIVIKGLCRIEQVGEAFELLNDMGKFGCSPDIFTYNAIIEGLCRGEEVDRAHELLKELSEGDGISPDVVTYTLLMSGYCKLGRIKEAVTVYEDMIRSGIKPNLYTLNVLIDGFGKVGDMVSAGDLYNEMLCAPDVITFTSLIDGYCRSCRVEQGLKYWKEIGARNLTPNVHSFCVLIHALCKENRLPEAHDFLRQLKDRNIVPGAFVYNPLIDGYCKSGRVDEADAVATEKEVVGCRHHKHTYTMLTLYERWFSEAISIFNRMLAAKCIPDDITVKSVDSCLLKAGMVNEAYQIKKIVSEDLSLEIPSQVPPRRLMKILRLLFDRHLTCWLVLDS